MDMTDKIQKSGGRVILTGVGLKPDVCDIIGLKNALSIGLFLIFSKPLNIGGEFFKVLLKEQLSE